MTTADSSPIDLGTFATTFFERAHLTVLQAVDGLTDAQLYQQPSPDTNSIAWLAWHLSRWKDQFAASVTGEQEVWRSGGWPERFGVAPERHGMGDTLDQVAAFRPPRDVLLGYVEAAQQATVERIARITTARFLEETAYAPGLGPRPIWRALVGIVSDTGQHTGQIAYLRGLLTGYGWRSA